MDTRPGALILKLGSQNPWPTWNMQFRAVLDSKNLGGVLEEQPAGGEASADSNQSEGEAAAPGRAAHDRMARGLMLLAVDDTFQPLIDESKTTREAWVKLEKLYAGNSRARRAALVRDWASLSQQQGESVQGYVQRVKTLATAMRSAGKEQDEEDITLAVLNGLDSKVYGVLRSIFLENPETTLEGCLPALLRQEQETVGGTGGGGVGIANISAGSLMVGMAPQQLRNLGVRDGPTAAPLSWCSGRTHNSTGLVRGRNSRTGPRRGGGPSRGQVAGRQAVNQTSAQRPVPGINGALRAHVQCHTCHSYGHFKQHCPQAVRAHSTPRALTAMSAPATVQAAPVQPATAPTFDSATSFFAFTTVACSTLIDLDGNPLPESAYKQACTAQQVDASAGGVHTINWVMDSGASNHMTPDITAFVDCTPCTGQVKVYGGRHLPVHGIGTVVIRQRSLTTGHLTQCSLTGVLYCPTADYSLLSVSRALQSGAGIEGTKDVLTLRLPTPIHGSMDSPHCITGYYNDSTSIYICPTVMHKPASETPNLLSAFSVTKATPELWHRRMGHLGMQNLMRMPSMAVGIELEGPAPHAPCTTCLECKQHKQSHPRSTKETTAPLQLVHSDVCGPMEGALSSNKSYFVTLLDDYTGYSVLIPIATKGEAPQAIMHVLKSWTNVCERTVKALRTDRGGEYVSNRFKEHLQQCGIEHQLSAPYSPQSNGKAERLNHTLLEKGRALICDAQLPVHLWPHALRTANLLRNLSPIKGKSVTPHELFHGRKPSLHRLRAYGCAAYIMLEPHERPSKLSPVSIRGQLIGYDPSGAYTILLSDRRTVRTSRDVQFDENLMPSRASAYDPIPMPQQVAPSAETGVQLTPLLDTLPFPPHMYPPHLCAPAQPAPPGGDAAPGAEPPVPHAPAAEPMEAEVQQPQPQQQELRRSQREHVRPAHLQGTYAPMGRGQWQANLVSMGLGRGSGIGFQGPPEEGQRRLIQWRNRTRDSAREHGRPIPKFSDASSNTNSSFAQALAVSSTAESTPYVPDSFAAAISSNDAQHWLAAAQEEMHALEANSTWTLAPTPPGVRPLPTKWVFSRKAGEQGERFKARLVAKGCAQKPGDYGELYTPVGRAQTIRAFLSRVAVLDLQLHQLDFTTAFLNGELKEGEEIWVNQPEGFEQGGPGISCRLTKALYGLKQAPRAWHDTLSAALEQEGLSACEDADPGLFISEHNGVLLIILVYVDDLLVASNSLEAVEAVKAKLLQRFKGKDLGEARKFLGMEIQRDRAAHTLTLTQQAYTTSIITKFGMQHATPINTPISTADRLEQHGTPADRGLYCEIVGSLLYLSTQTRPDIAFATGMCARYMHAPTTQHMNCAKNVLRYLNGTRNMGLQYKASTSSSLDIMGFGDADYAGDTITRKSTTGYVFNWGGAAISWCSKRQPTVSTSTMEAEYVAANATVREALWLRKLMQGFGEAGSNVCALESKMMPMQLFTDSQSALTQLSQPTITARSKHIDVCHHFARDRVRKGDVEFSYCRTEDMAADFLTKALSPDKFYRCCSLIGMVIIE